MKEEEKALNTHRLCSQGKAALAATDAGFLGGFSGGRGISTTVQTALNKRQTENTTQDSCLEPADIEGTFQQASP